MNGRTESSSFGPFVYAGFGHLSHQADVSMWMRRVDAQVLSRTLGHKADETRSRQSESKVRKDLWRLQLKRTVACYS